MAIPLFEFVQEKRGKFFKGERGQVNRDGRLKKGPVGAGKNGFHVLTDAAGKHIGDICVKLDATAELGYSRLRISLNLEYVLEF